MCVCNPSDTCNFCKFAHPPAPEAVAGESVSGQEEVKSDVGVMEVLRIEG